MHENEEAPVVRNEVTGRFAGRICGCEWCYAEPTCLGTMVEWIDHRIFKRCLVYKYSPEEIVAQNEVAELLDGGLEADSSDEGSEEESGAINNLMKSAIAYRVAELKGDINEDSDPKLLRSYTVDLGRGLSVAHRSNRISASLAF